MIRPVQVGKVKLKKSKKEKVNSKRNPPKSHAVLTEICEPDRCPQNHPLTSNMYYPIYIYKNNTMSLRIIKKNSWIEFPTRSI